jgi:acetyltransferase-like isoleucine patch superfamily enzyme
MLRTLKEFWWALRSPEERLHMKYVLVRGMPGPYGFRLREKVLRPYLAAMGEQVLVHEDVRIRGIHKLRLGDRVHVGVGNFLQASGGITIGDDTLLGPGVKIWTTTHVFADPDRPIREQGSEYREVVVGRDCWIGADTFIMPGTTLGDGCVVSAGSLVGAKTYPPLTILAGNPARVIGRRQRRAQEGGSPDEGSPDEGCPDEGCPDEGCPDEGSPADGPPEDGNGAG